MYFSLLERISFTYKIFFSSRSFQYLKRQFCIIINVLFIFYRSAASTSAGHHDGPVKAGTLTALPKSWPQDRSDPDPVLIRGSVMPYVDLSAKLQTLCYIEHQRRRTCQARPGQSGTRGGITLDLGAATQTREVVQCPLQLANHLLGNLTGTGLRAGNGQLPFYAFLKLRRRRRRLRYGRAVQDLQGLQAPRCLDHAG